MNYKAKKTMGASALLSLLIAPLALGHGAMQDPPARNYFCGAITSPDEALFGNPEYPQCADAFAFDQQQGYNFMSVLTHAEGRSVVSPLPQNVCGFDSESFGFGETVWDQPIDWPTTNMNPGMNKITWNISWGPHFDDTKEFKYWITKPGFQYQIGVPLTWNDFEEQPFCNLQYDHANPGAQPNVDTDVGAAIVDTYCDVPNRSGRHVIYGEWGRNFFTFERFHGCVDVTFQGGTDPDPDSDGDGVADAQDNCTLVSNTSQQDSDNDGYGNVCDPDINNDGVVNFVDISLWTPAFNTSNNGPEDFNGDGLVNFLDFSIMTEMFLLPPGPSGQVD